jgi:hypothetical protein
MPLVRASSFIRESQGQAYVKNRNALALIASVRSILWARVSAPPE